MRKDEPWLVKFPSYHDGKSTGISAGKLRKIAMEIEEIVKEMIML